MDDRAISPGASIAIIGAGIIGVTSAFDLAGRGYRITVFDPFPPGTGGPSWRNAGHVAGSDIEPLSTPGIMLEGMKLLLRKDSPLRIPGMEKLRLAPWFAQFLATSRGRRFKAASAAITHLCRHSISDMEHMLARAGIAEKMTMTGAGFIYDSSTSLAASMPTWRRKAKAGFTSKKIGRADIGRLLPPMNPKFADAILSHNWARVSDPLEIVQGIADAAHAGGVVFQRERVTGLVATHHSVALQTGAGESSFDAVVIAAGVRSGGFAAALGDKLPLVAERGYNLTFPDPGFSLDLPLILPDRGIAVTHVTEGLRIGGWAEYAASPDRPETVSCYADLSRISAELFPGLNQTGAVEWMGNRPSLPDSTPVISRARRTGRVFYNCGHGHYGLTFSAVSAGILGGLVDGREIDEKHEAYAITRFD